MNEKWLTWAKKLQSIAQAGLEYSKDKYDLERFEQIRDISVEIMHEYTDIDNSKLYDLFCNEVGYQTPKVDVRGIIIKDEKILLVKESFDGKWAPPGGWAEIGLSIKENTIKEAKEEAGVNVIPKRIIAIYDRNTHNYPTCAYDIYKVFVICDLIDGKFTENIETEASEFFSLDDLPDLSTGKITREQIEFCFKANENENLPVFFS
ncbi:MULTISPECIES: NUDIX hydrolase [Clostridium]|uniref:NUDIX hydrolase n=1 Tax=Clostridium cibarium TaxID=2762247 RepID=A0ABR8PXS5_9CLOT|nr:MULTISPECIES: NUDIX hydrolase [Clostridium]MBD7912972.1 NUDIX hydrolase [Clostridium cibarium]